MKHGLLLLVVVISALPCAAETQAQTPAPALARVHKEVHQHLRQGVISFWAEHAIDGQRGGYTMELAEDGSWTGVDKKYLLTQVRMVWFFARAHRHGIEDPDCLALARHGFDFVINNMWDETHGGFYWLVDGDGKVLKDGKSVYTQSFAIYALSEYYLASNDPQALAYAEQLFDLFISKASDGEYGFRENFHRDWTPKEGRTKKTLDTHMHLMECFTTLYAASGKAKHRQALEHMIALLTTKCIDPEHGYAYEPYDRQFKPIPRGEHMTTSYGHNVELGWLLLEALRVLEQDPEPYKQQILGMIDHALHYGWDDEHGGLALYGPPSGAVLEAVQLGEKRLLKSWWVQSEMLVALLEAYEWTGEETYKQAFLKIFDWISRHHIDKRHGGWYGIFSWDGKTLRSPSKGGGWKSAYHNGRALMIVEQRLQKILNQQ